MAGNKKIFDLPLRTGVTADDRLAIVDSGNTTTYSVKLSDLQDGTGVNTLESLTGNITFSGTNIDISTNGQTIVLSGSTGGGGGGGDLVGTTGDTLTNANGLGPADNIISGTTDFVNFGWNNLIQDGSVIFGYDNISDTSVTGMVLLGRGNTSGGNNSVGIGIDNNFSGGGSDGINIGRTNTNSRGTHIGKNNSNTNSTNNGGGVAVGASNTALGNDYQIFGSSNTGRGYMYGTSNNTHFENIVLGTSNTLSIGNSTLGNNMILGDSNVISAGYGQTIMSNDSDITSTGNYNTIVGGYQSAITGTTSGTTIIGLNGFTATANDMVYVPALNVVNYASLNFSGDTAAAAGGVELGGLYHDAGAVRVRIT